MCPDTLQRVYDLILATRALEKKDFTTEKPHSITHNRYMSLTHLEENTQSSRAEEGKKADVEDGEELCG